MVVACIMDQDVITEYWEANADAWTRLTRAGYDVYRDVLNTPAFLAMLPPVAGLDGLDIGCGEGANTRRLVQLGARMRAVDIAPTFIRHARAMEETSPLGIEFQLGDALTLPYADSSFDFATAFMSLMDVPDPGRALREAQRVLRPAAFLQFAILHPCFSPPYRKVRREADGAVRGIEVGDYFNESDALIDTWLFSAVPKEERQRIPPFRVPRFHRTLTSWVKMITEAGLVIQQFGEPSATEEVARAVPDMADTRVAGIFLHVRAVKPTVAVW
jgi:SAM-dependent methyltransferase